MSVRVTPFRTGGFEVDIRIQFPNGKRIRERVKSPVTSKSGSLRWGHDREQHLLLSWQNYQRRKEEAKANKKKPAPTVAEFHDRFIEGYARANRLKPSGIDSKQSVFRNYLLPRFGDRRLDQIRNEDVQRLKADLGKKAAKTVNNILTTMNVMLKVAVKWGVLEQMPAKIELLHVPPQADPRFYDYADYDKLVRAAEAHGPRALATVLLGGDAGLRRGEIIALEWTDVDLERGVLTVRHSEWKGEVTAPKSGRARRVKMTDKLQQALGQLRHLRGPRVLYRDDGGTVTAKVLRKWFEAVQRRAGLQVTGALHALRHTFCSHLAMRGAPARAIQELAGHQHLTTTMRYMHLSPPVADAAIHLLDKARVVEEKGELGETGTTG